MVRNRASAKQIEAASRGSAAAAKKLLAIPFRARLDELIEHTDAGCWEWVGYRYSNGYGAMGWQGKQRLVHRLSYTHFFGEIPEGLQIDHLCRNRACVNPSHLEAVTPRENTRRAMRTHCVNGHEFTDDNTYVPSDGKRYCRECRRVRVREYQQRRKNHDAK